MKKLYEAEGQSMGAVGSVITLIVGVGVAVLVLIFVGTLGGQTYQLTESKINEIGTHSASESITVLNGSAVSLSHSEVHAGSLTLNNGTIDVGLGNFSINYGTGAVTLTSGAEFNNSVMSASYEWGNTTVREHVKDGIISSFSALEQTGDYLPVIVLAVVISLVLVLVLGFTNFGTGGSKSAL